jgi:hypothetical protein
VAANLSIATVNLVKDEDENTGHRVVWNCCLENCRNQRKYPGASKIFDQMKWEKPPSIDRVYVIDKAKRALNYQPRDNFWTYLQSRKLSSEDDD